MRAKATQPSLVKLELSSSPPQQPLRRSSRLQELQQWSPAPPLGPLSPLLPAATRKPRSPRNQPTAPRSRRRGHHPFHHRWTEEESRALVAARGRNRHLEQSLDQLWLRVLAELRRDNPQNSFFSTECTTNKLVNHYYYHKTKVVEYLKATRKRCQAQKPLLFDEIMEIEGATLTQRPPVTREESAPPRRCQDQAGSDDSGSSSISSETVIPLPSSDDSSDEGEEDVDHISGTHRRRRGQHNEQIPPIRRLLAHALSASTPRSLAASSSNASHRRSKHRTAPSSSSASSRTRPRTSRFPLASPASSSASSSASVRLGNSAEPGSPHRDVDETAFALPHTPPTFSLPPQPTQQGRQTTEQLEFAYRMARLQHSHSVVLSTLDVLRRRFELAPTHPENSPHARETAAREREVLLQILQRHNDW
ncbi:hypothetical protein RI367_002683 [Sorochytrium milnesiophthora]